jgi:hypothetical protein
MASSADNDSKKPRRFSQKVAHATRLRDPIGIYSFCPLSLQETLLVFPRLHSQGNLVIPEVQATPTFWAKIVNLTLDRYHRQIALGARCFVAWNFVHFVRSGNDGGKKSLSIKSRTARKTGPEFRKIFRLTVEMQKTPVFAASFPRPN